MTLVVQPGCEFESFIQTLKLYMSKIRILFIEIVNNLCYVHDLKSGEEMVPNDTLGFKRLTLHNQRSGMMLLHERLAPKIIP